jgi:hypothetical protein
MSSDVGATPMASKANNELSAIALARGLGSTAPVFTDDEVLLLLRAAIEREGGQVAFAKRHRVDRVYLNMVLNGRRSVGSTALGLRVAYVAESTPAGCDDLRTTLHSTPWSVEETAACFVVRDHDGQAVTYVHFEADLGRRSVVTLFTRDEAEHIAAAVATLPELPALANKSTA